MSNINAVWYAESYHPIQAGSIDGTDVLPHDNAIYRALLCSHAGLYDPFGDPKVTGDPYCTVFVGRLSRHTQENTLSEVMSKYGRVKNIRLARDIVTGASRGYAFVEFETEREMRRAYEDAHHSRIDGSEVIVDYNRQQLMPGWIPRRLGGGQGGKKESGQLRFGGRERPFKAPLRPIPHDELKRLGIPPPHEGHYMSRFQVPSPPRRRKNNIDTEDSPQRHRSPDWEDTHSRHASKNREEPESRISRSRHRSQDREDSRSRSKHENSGDYKEGSVPRSSFKDRKEKESRSRHRSQDREDSRLRHCDRSEDRVDNGEDLRSSERSKEREDRSYKRHQSPSEESEESRHEHYKQHRGNSYKGERSHRHRSRSTRQD